ncbi:hypothetical protein [Streptomyces sp. Da 82-17]|uniref:hypothetical protein n=1 Tax=Streptomyces sp. Da 82-17 TaxID=3377116 RepID=UPI0038D36685
MNHNSAIRNRTDRAGSGGVRRPRRRLAVLCAGLALAVAAGGGTAAATGTAAPAGADRRQAPALQERVAFQERVALQGRIDRHLAAMDVPARQTGRDTIRTADGSTTITFTEPGEPRDSSCRSGRLCLWAGDHYDHKKVVFRTCAFRKLSAYGFKDRLTSFKNHQTRGTRTKFYVWRGHWAHVFGSTAPHRVPDLQGTEYNNDVDAVRVC